MYTTHLDAKYITIYTKHGVIMIVHCSGFHNNHGFIPQPTLQTFTHSAPYVFFSFLKQVINMTSILHVQQVIVIKNTGDCNKKHAVSEIRSCCLKTADVPRVRLVLVADPG